MVLEDLDIDITRSAYTALVQVVLQDRAEEIVTYISQEVWHKSYTDMIRDPHAPIFRIGPTGSC